MRTIIAFVIALLAGCTSAGLPPGPESSAVDAAPPGWVEFDDTFQIQADFDAIEQRWQDAEAQCESNGARLPTSGEWDIVILSGYMGVSPPYYREWYRDADGKTGTIDGHGAGLDVDATAFRCARSVSL